jgi:hypothetical protein
MISASQEVAAIQRLRNYLFMTDRLNFRCEATAKTLIERLKIREKSITKVDPC